MGERMFKNLIKYILAVMLAAACVNTSSAMKTRKNIDPYKKGVRSVQRAEGWRRLWRSITQGLRIYRKRKYKECPWKSFTREEALKEEGIRESLLESRARKEEEKKASLENNINPFNGEKLDSNEGISSRDGDKDVPLLKKLFMKFFVCGKKNIPDLEEEEWE